MNDAHRFFNFEEEKVTDILLQQFQDLHHANMAVLRVPLLINYLRTLDPAKFSVGKYPMCVGYLSVS